MQGGSRVLKSQYNLIASLVNNVVVTILGFVTRTVFVHSLGADYLGLNGLFTNVLSLLSLAELGVGNAITFSLYKPIAEKNEKKIQALMELYKHAYQIIGWVVFGVGIAIVPFLKYIVNLDVGVEINYIVIYIMFLSNSVISYWFFAYRGAIIYAHQEGYLLTKYETVFALVKSVLQFAVLFFIRNYYVYLTIPILVGIIKNLIVSKIAGEKFPYIDGRVQEPLTKEEKEGIFKNVYALALFKISGVVYGATDNIIISTWLGTKIVGILSNYTMITQLVGSYVNMFFQSMYASVGNLNATETIEYKYSIFKKLDLLNYWIYTYCTICLACFLNPCISVWLGDEFCLEQSTVILIALVFYIPGLNNVINIFKDACGLFKEVQYRALATAIVNLLVSISLVIRIGINGVFIGTIVAYLTTIYIVDPRIVYTKVFKTTTKKYYYALIKKILLFEGCGICCLLILERVRIESLFGLIVVFVCISFLFNLVFILVFHRTDEFHYLCGIITKSLKKLRLRAGGSDRRE